MTSIFDLSGKSALITGASSGIGSHFAETLTQAGANVVLASRRTRRLKKRAKELKNPHTEISWVQLDVTNRDSVEAAFHETATLFGRIDIVVNNAGIASQGLALETTERTWDDVIATNLKGVWLVAQQAGQHMAADSRGGTIINIASILGRRVMGGVAPYAAAKAAVEHLTRVLAYEWARHSIRVNAIAPGYIVTDMNRDYLESPLGEKAKLKIPQKRFGRPEDLDGPLLLLASDASSYMTGSTIVADGGHLQSSM